MCSRALTTPGQDSESHLRTACPRPVCSKQNRPRDSALLICQQFRPTPLDHCRHGEAAVEYADFLQDERSTLSRLSKRSSAEGRIGTLLRPLSKEPFQRATTPASRSLQPETFTPRQLKADPWLSLGVATLNREQVRSAVEPPWAHGGNFERGYCEAAMTASRSMPGHVGSRAHRAKKYREVPQADGGDLGLSDFLGIPRVNPPRHRRGLDSSFQLG
uniref:Uncharacterized protein n=1 Tax=Chrysotila carterae TaxID=13221 RepID=A0A7S4C168_CHRCT